MDSAKSQLIDRLKTARSVLVTVSRDPSVDQLAACIALTLIVNKLGGHGSAVFSGQIPSTIEFLKPEETIEKTADSLRDFIISLDKSKADKLRYKLEDQVVKIFITPYKTSISEEDLEFSQGDYNVELVVAIGVKEQEDLDQAISAHGRILHDATVACINNSQQGSLGSLNWQDETASSLCELVTDLVTGLDDKLLDEQIATALLTGIIAETDRFSNEKTTAQTMSVSAKLMASGANQQLVATNLSNGTNSPAVSNEQPVSQEPETVGQATNDGTLNIEHNEAEVKEVEDILNDNNGEVDSALSLSFAEDPNSDSQKSGQLDQESVLGPPPDILPPPVIKDVKTTYTDPKDEPSDVLSAPEPPIFTPPPESAATATPAEPPVFTPPPQDWTPPTPPEAPKEEAKPALDKTEDKKTLSEIEKDVNSPHQTQSVDEAREKVESLVSETAPDQAIGSMPLGSPLHEDDKEKPVTEDSIGNTGLNPSLFSEVPAKNQPAPPVPPPIPFPMDKPTVSDGPTV